MSSGMVLRAPRPAPPGAPIRRLPSVPASVPEARAFTREALRTRIVDEEALYDAQLVACELASNAIKHGGSGSDRWIEIVATVEDDEALFVSVSDPGSGFDPAARYDPPPGEGATGWGLVIVSRVASRWGAWPGRRFTVWAEIDLWADQTGRV
jgi:anti-sigma regulatory factor (Ser/Thr protein kinase)